MFRSEITEMGDNVLRVILYDDEGEVGVLYFERAKKAFVSKPIGMNQWLCVDAKVEKRIYEVGGLTPMELLVYCQGIIGGLFFGDEVK